MLKQSNALTCYFFYSRISHKEVRKNQEEVEMNCLNQVPVCADDINLSHQNVSTL
jgi:hypothetical protein